MRDETIYCSFEKYIEEKTQEDKHGRIRRRENLVIVTGNDTQSTQVGYTKGKIFGLMVKRRKVPPIFIKWSKETG